ncbi:LysM peptidoglycan-binding domain-containing protein [Winogradskyella maritima]|nr:LysM peptidoglycan-binding domain-containing protein [Winogradskyella maritima]
MVKKSIEPVIAKAKNDYHVVQPGDTLYSLSKKYAVSVDDLMRWNYMYNTDLAVGQKLTVKTETYNK